MAVIENSLHDRTACQTDTCADAIEALHSGIAARRTDLDEILWRAVIAHQGERFYTASGLPFRYVVNRTRDGTYGGELCVSRKESSKTLTKSSVLLAFHKVLDNIAVAETAQTEPCGSAICPPLYRGPKAIGQIFGISYIYSLFWRLGLIAVPEKIENKLKGENEREMQQLKLD